MTAQWISPLICEYPIHGLRPLQIVSRHLTSALKAKQPCSWKKKTFILRSVVGRAALDCCDNAPRLTEETQRTSALCLAHQAMLSSPHGALVFKKKGEKRKASRKDSFVTERNKRVTAFVQFAVRQLRRQAAWGWISLLFSGRSTDLSLAISPPTCNMPEYRPRCVPIPDPRAMRGRHAFKQEVYQIKRTNQIAVQGRLNIITPQEGSGDVWITQATMSVCVCVCARAGTRVYVRLIYTGQRLHPTAKYLPLCNCHPPTQSCD